jgi:hypothetical protein
VGITDIEVVEGMPVRGLTALINQPHVHNRVKAGGKAEQVLFDRLHRQIDKKRSCSPALLERSDRTRHQPPKFIYWNTNVGCSGPVKWTSACARADCRSPPTVYA